MEGSKIDAALSAFRAWPTYAQGIAGVLVLALIAVAGNLAWRKLPDVWGMLRDLWDKLRGLWHKLFSAPPTPSLLSLWERFLKGLPSEARLLPVVLVLGRSGAGKTTLIKSRQDWEGLDRQLFPSVPDDARLGLYVGRSALVQEISWALLAAKGADVEQQLDALWRPLFSDRSPTVVLVVSASDLASPDELRELADYVRGKLNLVTKIRGQPVPIRLCLSHVDELPGYRPVAATLGEGRAELALTLSEPVDERQLARALAPLEDRLPRVLVADGSADFKRAVGLFAQDVPRVSRGIAPLLRELGASAYLSRPPTVTDLSLTGREPGDCVGDPLAVDAQETSVAAQQRSRRHLQIAAALTGGAVAAAAGLLGWHRVTVGHAEDAVSALVKTAADARSLGRERVGSRAVLDRERDAAERLRTMNQQESWPIFRGTWAADKKKIRDDALATLRDFYVAARLDADEKSETILRAVALTRASAEGGLGAMIADDAPAWADALRLPQPVVRDYVALSPTTWEGTLTVPRPAPARVQPAARDLGVWLAYLDGLQAIFGRGAITAAELTANQQQTTSLLTVLDDATRWDAMRVIEGRLLQEAPYDRDAVEPLLAGGDVYDWVSKNRVVLAGLLGLVRDTSLDAAAMSQTNLSGLLSALGSAPTLSLAEATYALTLKQRQFSFKSKDWGDVVTRSRSSLLVDAFLRNPREGSYGFFANPKAYPASGRAVVAGKGPSAAVPGIYTRDAFDREVSPALVTFGEQIAKLPLSGDERDKLTSYVSSQVESYAAGYRSALSAYYSSFQLHASSAAVLRAILGELALPSSFLSDFLATVARSAGLELKDGDYFKTIGKQLESFEPIVALMVESKGQYPNLAKYTAMVALFAAPAGLTGGAGSALADRLSPMGRAALSILRSDKDSIVLAVDPWLAASGIGAAHMAPFTTPVQLGYQYGIAEVEQAISAAWQAEILPDVSPLVAKFPFNAKSDDDANPLDVTAVFVPAKGKFWVNAELTLVPVCTLKGQRWAAITGPYGSARLPRGELSTLNGAAQMGRLLWDKDGKPQPLELGLEALALPDAPQKDVVPTLAALRTGAASVFAFNQKAQWETVQLAWDKEGSSSLELQLGSPESTRKQSRTIDGGDGAWSFYRLRAKATTDDNGVVTWRVPVSTDGPSVSVRFGIRGAAWTPFQISMSGS